MWNAAGVGARFLQPPTGWAARCWMDGALPAMRWKVGAVAGSDSLGGEPHGARAGEEFLSAAKPQRGRVDEVAFAALV